MQKRECRKLNVRCSGSGGRWPSAHRHKFKVQSNWPLKLAKERDRQTDRQRPRQTQRVLWFLCPINRTIREMDSPTDRLTLTEKWASSALMEVDQLHIDTSCKPTSTEADHYTHRHKLKTDEYRGDHYTHRHKLKTNEYRGGPLHTQTQVANRRVQRRTITHTDTSWKPTSTEADHYTHRHKLQTNEYRGGPLWPSSRCTQARATWTTQNLVPQNSAPAYWQQDHRTSTAGRPTKRNPKESVLAGGKEAFQQPGGLGNIPAENWSLNRTLKQREKQTDRQTQREKREEGGGGEGGRRGREREREWEIERQIERELELENFNTPG